ncbi:MAG: biotin/lipoyl-containing protein, partial [Caldimonas sp.]
MAIVEVKVPQLSESVAEATLVQWKKRPGDAVALDEILVEIETDKVVLEVPAPSAGVMSELLKNDGETCLAEEVIARIDSEGVAAASPSGSKPAVAAPEAAAPTNTQAPVAGKGAVAMPSAAKLMADHKVAGESLSGTGKGGRITKGDVLTALDTVARAPAVGSPAATAPIAAVAPKPSLPAVPVPTMQSLGERPEQRVPMSRLRARIAERLVQSQSTNAILTTFNEVNMAPVMDMRKRFQE